MIHLNEDIEWIHTLMRSVHAVHVNLVGLVLEVFSTLFMICDSNFVCGTLPWYWILNLLFLWSAKKNQENFHLFIILNTPTQGHIFSNATLKQMTLKVFCFEFPGHCKSDMFDWSVRCKLLVFKAAQKNISRDGLKWHLRPIQTMSSKVPNHYCLWKSFILCIELL